MDKDKLPQPNVKTKDGIIKSEPERLLTEEESEIETTKEQEKQFFDDDDEIIEVNFD